jgi:hypothetical protein
MTDQIHRNIEQHFKHYDLYYDRRKGFYRDQARPIRRIVSVTSLAQAMISIVLQKPNDARGRPGAYFKEDWRYDSIFKINLFPLPVYLNCCLILRRVEDVLSEMEISRGDEANLKFYTAARLACELTREVNPSPQKLAALDASNIHDSLVKICFFDVMKIYRKLSETIDRDAVARGPDLLKRLRARVKRLFDAKPKRGPHAKRGKIR